MKRKTHQEFIVDMKNKNPNITVCGTYLNNKRKINVKCLICGHLWASTPNSLLCGHGCPKCSERYKRTHDEFISEMNHINPNICIISKFINTSTKVKCICKKCNHIWSSTPNHLLGGIGCPNCKAIKIGNIRRIDNEEFIKRIEIENKNIEILSKYKSALQKVKCRCKLCDKFWKSTPANLLQGHGCPMCKESKGEKKIYLYLLDNNIEFETQKKYDDLLGVNNGLLSYDFYLPKQNLLIEYQGLQHHQAVDFKGQGVEFSNHQLSIQKEHDKRKREYASQNGIDLLEIWYYDFDNISKILNKSINSD
ncbi:MAG: hypothetical protein II304_03610 [Bacteroidales bacterium]|nr:hypothetical protein [Bacteroidales bacterium]